MNVQGLILHQIIYDESTWTSGLKESDLNNNYLSLFILPAVALVLLYSTCVFP